MPRKRNTRKRNTRNTRKVTLKRTRRLRHRGGSKTIKYRNYLVLIFSAACSSLVFEIFALFAFMYNKISVQIFTGNCIMYIFMLISNCPVCLRLSFRLIYH